MTEESQVEKLQRLTNPTLFRALGHSPFEAVDIDHQGYIDLEEFVLYFSKVASAEEAEHAFKLLTSKECEKLTYGEWQAFQQAFEEREREVQGKSGKVGCPDFLDYATMLLGMKLSLTRKHFLDKVNTAGLSLPVSDEWLESEMAKEWLCHPNFATHWEYVIEVCPMEEEGRRFPDWAGGFSVRDAGHEGMSVDDFCAVPVARKAGLGRPDVLGLRLYTGPGYLALNRSLRAHTHRFPVTQFCIDRAVGRLARVGAPKHLFRGLRKKMHPRWSRQYEVYRGVGHHKLALVDCAFVSTTLDMEVAAGPTFGGPVVFQLRTRDPLLIDGAGLGFLCGGGSISWASQYPDEVEVLLPSNTIMVPQLLCNHMDRRDPSIPKGRDVYRFFPFYPWDFANNMPFMAAEYLTAANTLLLAVHRLDVAVLEWCHGGHVEDRNPYPLIPPPSRTNHTHRPVPKLHTVTTAGDTDSCSSGSLPSPRQWSLECRPDTFFSEADNRMVIFLQDASPGGLKTRPCTSFPTLDDKLSRSSTPATPLWPSPISTFVNDATDSDSAPLWPDLVPSIVPSLFSFSPLVQECPETSIRPDHPRQSEFSQRDAHLESNCPISDVPSLKGTDALRLAKIKLFTLKDVANLESTYQEPQSVSDHLTEEAPLSSQPADPPNPSVTNPANPTGGSGGSGAFPEEAINVGFSGGEWDPGRLNCMAMNVTRAVGLKNVRSFWIAKLVLLCLLLLSLTALVGLGVGAAKAAGALSSPTATNNTSVSPSPSPSPEVSPPSSPLFSGSPSSFPVTTASVSTPSDSPPLITASPSPISQSPSATFSDSTSGPPSPSPTPSAIFSHSPSPSASKSFSPTPSPSAIPSNTASFSQSGSPSPTPSHSANPSNTPSPSETSSPTPSPTPSPSVLPSDSPSPISITDVWCWGDNTYNEVPSSALNPVCSPTAVGFGSAAAELAAGVEHAAALTSSGAVYTWGGNDYGQLGLNTASISVGISLVSGSWVSITAIAAGDYHTGVLDTSGNLWMWGLNSIGQLGLGTVVTLYKQPTEISSGWSALSLGGNTSAALDQFGGWYVWGNLSFCSSGAIANTSSPLSWTTGSYATVAQGSFHGGAIDFSGSLYTWGDNSAGQLGQGSIGGLGSCNPVAILGSVSSVSLGYLHSCAIKAGSLYCWGDNTYGELGDDTTTSIGSPLLITDAGGVASVSAGKFFTFIVNSSSTSFLYGSGTNHICQLGEESTINNPAERFIATVPSLTVSVLSIGSGVGGFCVYGTST